MAIDALEIEDVTIAYGGIRAVRNVSLGVPEGGMVALIGPNGAGKTTLLRAVSGLLKVKAGRIAYRGRSISSMRPHRIARLGLMHVPEGRQVLAPLTIQENLDLARTAAKDRGTCRFDRDSIFDFFPRLGERRRQLAGSLSGGEQQMLAIGRALMGNPDLLLLDEPSLGLAPRIVSEVFAVLRKLNEDGLTILVVEQNAQLALTVTGYCYVLERGEVVRSGASSELSAHADIISHYLGSLG